MYRFFITYVLFILFYSCEIRNEEAYCITYSATRHEEIPGKMLISYKDTTGYVSFFTSEKSWSQDVCLLPGDFASLLVVYHPVFDMEINDLSLYDLYPETDCMIISGKIIHSKKTVRENSSNVVMIDLFPEEL